MHQSTAPIAALGLICCSAGADFIGWTSSVRSVAGGRMVNVFAVTNSAGDRLVSVYGGRPASPGQVATNAPGGFLQGAAAQGAFQPVASQTWNDLDSFLTIGGAYDAPSDSWLVNGSTLGDPGWQFSAPGLGMSDGFSTLPTAPSGPWNPWLHSIPTGAGWYAVGSGAAALSLSPIASVRQGYALVGGVNLGASSTAAANGSFGMLVAQLFVADLEQSRIDWRMGATIRRANGTAQQGEFAFTIGHVPSPGAAAILLLGGLTHRRRRA